MATVDSVFMACQKNSLVRDDGGALAGAPLSSWAGSVKAAPSNVGKERT
jgi:hypothetical protein